MVDRSAAHPATAAAGPQTRLPAAAALELARLLLELDAGTVALLAFALPLEVGM